MKEHSSIISLERGKMNDISVPEPIGCVYEELKVNNIVLTGKHSNNKGVKRSQVNKNGQLQ